MRIGGRSSSAVLHKFTLKELRKLTYRFDFPDYLPRDYEHVCADLPGDAGTGLPVRWRR